MTTFKNFVYVYSLSVEVNHNVINNVELYKAQVKKLAQVLESLFVQNPESQAAGMVINTMGWIDDVGYEVTVQAFSFIVQNFCLKTLLKNDLYRHFCSCFS